MTLLITYDDTEELGRVRLSFSGYDAAADYATVERSSDQVTWAYIRGGDNVPLTAGSGHIDDYEFSASVINYYRVTAVDAADPTVIGQGTAPTANNASVSPTLPSGTTGDLMVLQAAIRNSGTGTVNLPAGWTSLVNSGNTLIAGRVRQVGDTAPTVTFTGGAAGADTAAVITSLRGVTMTGAVIPSALLNGVAQDILTPGNAYANKDFTLRFAWKQAVTTVMACAGYTTGYWMNATAGTGMSQSMFYLLRSGAGLDPATVITSAGGTTAISRGITISFPKIASTNQDTGNITPSVAYYRIKNPSRPSLNIRVTPVQISDITRPARAGVFNVLGRTLPVSVTDLQGARTFSLSIDVYSYSAMVDMDNRLASGDPMFLQAPTQPDQVPTLYFVAGDIVCSQDSKGDVSYTFTIPVVEVAAPAFSVVGATSTWQDVVNAYATWSALIAAKATWSDVQDIVSTSSVIVP